VDVATHADNQAILQELALLPELELFQEWVGEHLSAAEVLVEVSHHVEDLLAPEDLQLRVTSVDRETTVLGIVLHRESSAMLAERVDISLVTVLPLTAAH